MRSELGHRVAAAAAAGGAEARLSRTSTAAVELIGRRWTGAILYALADEGPLRFAELKEAVPGMSDRLLSARLKELEDAGPGPPRGRSRAPASSVSYELTRKGESLKPVMGTLRDWARRWHPA